MAEFIKVHKTLLSIHEFVTPVFVLHLIQNIIVGEEKFSFSHCHEVILLVGVVNVQIKYGFIVESFSCAQFIPPLNASGMWNFILNPVVIAPFVIGIWIGDPGRIIL